MIWPLVCVPVAALLSFLWSQGFFYRIIKRRRIGELDREPWWMGVCFPLTKATGYEVAIIPFNLVLMYSCRFVTWLHGPPVWLWKEAGEMQQENKKLKNENYKLLIDIQFWRKRDQGIEVWDIAKAPQRVMDGIVTPNKRKASQVAWVPENYRVPLWLQQGAWSDAEVHVYEKGKVILGLEPPWEDMVEKPKPELMCAKCARVESDHLHSKPYGQGIKYYYHPFARV